MFYRTPLAAAALVALCAGAAAQDAPAVPAPQDAQQAEQAQDAADTPAVQRVEITGTSIKRTDAETAAPVQVITRTQIERSGATSTEQLLKSISATTSAGSVSTANAAGASTGSISTVSLRGLTAERTLVLVNGKRIAPYGSPGSSVSVDVDAIPISAIERVEVLKDGASAIYGSDAIAGVINFILRKDFSGTEISAGYGQAYDGKAGIARASGVTGWAGDNYGLMLMANFQRDRPLFGADRAFAANSIRLDQFNDGSSSRTDPGNIDIPGVPGTYNPSITGAPGDCGPNSVAVPEVDPNRCFFDPAPFVLLTPDVKRVGLLLSGHFDLSDTTSLYGDFSYSRKQVHASIQPAPADIAFGIPFTMTTANPFYPTDFVTGLTGGATPDLRVRYRPFITGNREWLDTGENLRLVLGARGTAWDWDWDASLLHSSSRVTEDLLGGYYYVFGSPDTGPGIVPLFNGEVLGADGQPLWVNPFGENTQEVIAAARATNFVGTAFQTRTSINGVQGVVSRSLMKLGEGDLALALGGEVRAERYVMNSSDALATGDISGYGGAFADIDRTRRATGLFAEISATPLKTLELSAALRMDRYGATSNPGSEAAALAVMQAFTNPAGETLDPALAAQVAAQSVTSGPSFGKATGKLGAKWRVMPELALRATYATGFRAPSLLDLYGPLTNGVTAVMNDSARCGVTQSADDCVTQFNVYAGGRGDLKPERSRSLTLGFVAEPVKNVSLSVDYYRIDMSNLITALGPEFLIANEAAYPGRVGRGAFDTVNNVPGGIIAIDQRLENIGEVNISGIDWDLRAKYPLEVGHVFTEWQGSYQASWDAVNPDGSKDSAIGITSDGAGGVIPRLRQTLTVGWDSGANWRSSLTYNWQSSFTDVCGNLAQDEFGACAPGFTPPHVGSYETLDLQASYSGFEGLTLTAGIKDLLNKEPPYVNGNGGAFQDNWDPTYVDPRGRFLYVNATYRF